MRLPNRKTDRAQHQRFRVQNTFVKVGNAVSGHQRILRVGGQLVQQRLVFPACLLDRAAILMAEYHQKAHAEHVHRVFQRGDHGIVYDLPCCAHGEQVAYSRVENDVGADTRIRAAQYRRIRLMRVDNRLARFRTAVRVHRLALRESAIACQQTVPNAARRALDLILVHKHLICH